MAPCSQGAIFAPYRAYPYGRDGHQRWPQKGSPFRGGQSVDKAILAAQPPLAPLCKGGCHRHEVTVTGGLYRNGSDARTFSMNMLRSKQPLRRKSKIFATSPCTVFGAAAPVRNQFFDRLGSPFREAGTAIAVTEGYIRTGLPLRQKSSFALRAVGRWVSSLLSRENLL